MSNDSQMRNGAASPADGASKSLARGVKGGPPSEPAPPFSWAVLFRLGGIYLKRFLGLAVLYLGLSILAISILPVSVTLLYSDISDHYSEKGDQKSAASGPEQAASPAPAQGAAAQSQAPGRGHESFIDRLPVQTQYTIWVSLLIGVLSMNFLLRYVQSYFDGSVANSLRGDLFAAILRQSPSFFMKNDSNRLNMVLSQYSQQAEMGLRQMLIDPVLQIVAIGVAGTALFERITAMTLNPTLWTLIIVIGLFGLVAPWVTTLLSSGLQNVAGAFQGQNLRLATLVGNALQAPEEIQALQAEGFFDGKHAKALHELFRLRLNQTMAVERLNMLNRLPNDLVQIALLALVVFFMPPPGTPGAVSPGTILALALLTPQFMGAVQGISSYSINRSVTWPSVAAVNGILSLQPDVVEGPMAKRIELTEPTLEFRNVVFSYQPGTVPPVLNDVSYQLAPRQWTGLVGRSGQGKSTSLRLALRFFDFQSGDILLGGKSVRDFTLESLRNQVALMVQLPAFFYDTVRENLRVARPDATDEEIREVCELTGVWEKLIPLFGPDPLNAEFAGGMLLNPGNRKRFALARSLLRRPSFVFLDEPTAGLNPDNKFPLIPDLRKACEGKTVFLIEQDMLWLEQICDYILVLDAGSIVQRGTPAELSAQGGLYTELRDAHLRMRKQEPVAAAAPAHAEPAIVRPG
jgi:ATP-binding cassette subfamily B protein